MKRDVLIEIVKEFKAEIVKILTEKFDEIILFGSYARGDNTEYSDVDLVLVVKEALSKTEKEKLTNLLSYFSLKYDLVLVCIDYPKAIFEKYKTPFLLNVKEEGIKI